MQEIFASDPGRCLPQNPPRRVAILLWRFRQTRPGETATTTWRRLIPPPLLPLQSLGISHSAVGRAYGDHFSQLAEAGSPTQSNVAWSTPWPNSPVDYHATASHLDVQQVDGQQADFHFYPEPPASFPIAMENSLPNASLSSSAYAHPPTPFSSQTPASRLSFNEAVPSCSLVVHESAPQSHGEHRPQHCESVPLDASYTGNAIAGGPPSGLGLEPLPPTDFSGLSQERVSEYSFPNNSDSESLSNFASSHILFSMNGGLPPPTATLHSMPSHLQPQQSHPYEDARQEPQSSSAVLASSHPLPSNILAPQPRHLVSTDRIGRSEEPITPASNDGPAEEHSQAAASQVDGQEVTSHPLGRPYDPEFCADGELLAQFAAVSEHHENQTRQHDQYWQQHAIRPPHHDHSAGGADELCGDGRQLAAVEAQRAFSGNAPASGYEGDSRAPELARLADGTSEEFMGESWTMLQAVQAFAKEDERLHQQLAGSDWTTLDPETLHQNHFAHTAAQYEELGQPGQRPTREDGAGGQVLDEDGGEVQEDAGRLGG